MNLAEIFYLHRPEASNAIDLKTALELSKALKRAVKSRQSGFIIASQIPGIFCAGGDLKAYSKMKTKGEGVRVNKTIRESLRFLSHMPLATIAAIEGDAIGGGCELALSCDHIVASNTARFAFRQSWLGLTPGWGGWPRLLSRVGRHKAYDWLSSGRWISAAEAHRCGLVDEVVLPGIALSAAQDFINARSRIDSKTHILLKKLIFHSKNPVADADKTFDALWFGKAHLQALKRFSQK